MSSSALPYPSACAIFKAEHRRASVQCLGVSTSKLRGSSQRVAAKAKARMLTLLTRDVGEFSRVSGLRVEDWETARSLSPAENNAVVAGVVPARGRLRRVPCKGFVPHPRG